MHFDTGPILRKDKWILAREYNFELSIIKEKYLIVVSYKYLKQNYISKCYTSSSLIVYLEVRYPNGIWKEMKSSDNISKYINILFSSLYHALYNIHSTVHREGQVIDFIYTCISTLICMPKVYQI